MIEIIIHFTLDTRCFPRTVWQDVFRFRSLFRAPFPLRGQSASAEFPSSGADDHPLVPRAAKKLFDNIKLGHFGKQKNVFLLVL